MSHPLLDPVIIRAVQRAATSHLGRRWAPAGFTDLSDRASHPCGIFTGTPAPVFAKLDASPQGQARLRAELNGWRLIRQRAGVATPVPVAAGLVVTERGSLLLSEAVAERAPGQAAGERTPEDYAAIGRALAGLHQARGEAFGLADFDGFFGPLPQANAPLGPGQQAWADFYARRRVLPALRLAVDSGHLPAGLARGAERVAARLPRLCGPEPAPALLHGDAQQNNFILSPGGAVAIDAAPYFGHPEVDLAAVDIFAPADAAFLRAYEQAAPLDGGFAGRRELWRLHAYLAVVAAAGPTALGRSFLRRLAAAVRQYA